MTNCSPLIGRPSPVYGGRGAGHHVGGVMAQIQLGVPGLVNVGPRARLDLREIENIYTAKLEGE